MQKDYYGIMGVSPQSNLTEIKLKYRQLALIYHPDKNQGEKTDAFLKIQEAYFILSDSKARLQYDMVNGVDNSIIQKRKVEMNEQEQEAYSDKKKRLDAIIQRLADKQSAKKAEQLKQQKKQQMESEALRVARKDNYIAGMPPLVNFRT